MLFCIPAGLAVLYAFHRFFKRPMVLLCRNRFARVAVCGPFPLLPLRRLAWVATLIFLGAVTHVVWDGFTHEDEWTLRDYPQIATVMITVAATSCTGADSSNTGAASWAFGLLAWWSVAMVPPGGAGCTPADYGFLAAGPPRDRRGHGRLRGRGRGLLRPGLRLQVPGPL